MRIACLHTAESNVAVYDAATSAPGVVLAHRVRKDLLDAAERAGGLTEEIRDATLAALEAAAEAADAVLLTCSTLGPVVEAAPGGSAVPVLRADQALAEAAVSGGGEVMVLCAVETTIVPTSALFERAAAATGARIELRLIEGAWAAFKRGDLGAYFALIAEAAERGRPEGAGCVVLAQSSMAPAVALCSEPLPLASPAAGLAAACAAARSRAG